MELSEDQKMLADYIIAQVSNNLHAECRFSDHERKKLHDFLDAVDVEKADHETHIYVLRIGNNVKLFIKRASQAVVWSIIVLIAYLILSSFGLKTVLK